MVPLSLMTAPHDGRDHRAVADEKDAIRPGHGPPSPAKPHSLACTGSSPVTSLRSGVLAAARASQPQFTMDSGLFRNQADTALRPAKATAVSQVRYRPYGAAYKAFLY